MLEKLTNDADFARAEAMLARAPDHPHRHGLRRPRLRRRRADHGSAAIADPPRRGLAGHSDADVVLHAITDALLGAPALGDIGEHFPPSRSAMEAAPTSAIFLEHAARSGPRRPAA